MSLEWGSHSRLAEPVKSPWVILIIVDTHGGLPFSNARCSSSNSLDNYDVLWSVLLYRWGSKTQQGQEAWSRPQNNTHSSRVGWDPTGPGALNSGPLCKLLPLNAASRAKVILVFTPNEIILQLSKNERAKENDDFFFSFRLRSRFVRRLTKQSSTWLLARVSVVVFLRVVTDPSWGLADLILQT